MTKRSLKNEQLDTLAAKLLAGTPLPQAEIERIVARQDLFAGVLNKIERIDPVYQPSAKRYFSLRQVAALSLVAVVLAVSAGVVLFRPVQQPQKYAVAVKEEQLPEAEPEAARPEVPPQPIDGELSSGRAAQTQPRIERAVFRKKRTIEEPVEFQQASARFYPVSYTGDPSDVAAGGQIVRVELKRSSAFALGVALPLENDEATVSAELLIGRDGVTRAVRLVD